MDFIESLVFLIYGYRVFRFFVIIYFVIVIFYFFGFISFMFFILQLLDLRVGFCIVCDFVQGLSFYECGNGDGVERGWVCGIVVCYCYFVGYGVEFEFILCGGYGCVVFFCCVWFQNWCIQDEIVVICFIVWCFLVVEERNSL